MLGSHKTESVDAWHLAEQNRTEQNDSGVAITPPHTAFNGSTNLRNPHFWTPKRWRVPTSRPPPSIPHFTLCSSSSAVLCCGLSSFRHRVAVGFGHSVIVCHSCRSDDMAATHTLRVMSFLILCKQVKTRKISLTPLLGERRSTPMSLPRKRTVLTWLCLRSCAQASNGSKLYGRQAQQPTVCVLLFLRRSRWRRGHAIHTA